MQTPPRRSSPQSRKSGLAGHTARNDEFYLGVLRDDSELWHLHLILAGGPSRGTMALDTETAPGQGTSVQVCRTHHLFPEHTGAQRIHIVFPPPNDESRYCASLPKNTLAFVASPQSPLVVEEEVDAGYENVG